MTFLEYLSTQQETVPGTLGVTSGQPIRELLQMKEDELKQYCDPPPSLYARVTDGSGNVYEGTLHLVEKKAGAMQ